MAQNMYSNITMTVSINFSKLSSTGVKVLHDLSFPQHLNAYEDAGNGTCSMNLGDQTFQSSRSKDEFAIHASYWHYFLHTSIVS